MANPASISLEYFRPLLQVASGVLAAGASYYFERTCARRGLLPPGFRVFWRRALAFMVLAGLFWLAVFGPLAMIGAPTAEVDFKGVSIPQLFAVQMLLTFVTLSWFALGFAVRPRPRPVPVPAAMVATSELPPPDEAALEVPDALGAEALEVLREPPELPETALPELPEETGDGQDEILFEAPPSETASVPVLVEAGPPPVPPVRPTLGAQFAAQLGFRAPRPGAEIGFGLVAGFAIWFAVLLALFLIAAVTVGLGGERFLPKQAPAMIPWIAGLPIGIRLLLSLSAGFVEETFFRGLLQPRVGIAFSTACFVLAHAAYGSPFLLIGVTLLSLIYAFLVRWRQNLWPAIAAHALFDGIQLLVVIPAALRFMKP
ncbi:MAG TPA: CPBP family intramembrane glutamic endopeptidase [Thermoanaerobaculia bacterium]|nr:CPBP family intramembrane glutamic endopeptidase [Thermoanaerobaculia bacterium]